MFGIKFLGTEKINGIINAEKATADDQPDYLEKIEACTHLDQLLDLMVELKTVPPGDERDQLLVAYNEKGRALSKANQTGE